MKNRFQLVISRKDLKPSIISIKGLSVHANIPNLVDKELSKYLSYFKKGIWTAIRVAFDNAEAFLTDKLNELHSKGVSHAFPYIQHLQL